MFFFRKIFEKQTKTNEEQGQKHVKALEVLKPEENKKEGLKSAKGLFPNEMRTNEIKNETDEIKKWEEKIRREDLVYETNKYKCDFQQYDVIKAFGDSIYNGKISIDEAEIDKSSLLEGLKDFDDRSKPKTVDGKNKKRNTYKSAYAPHADRQLILNAFRSGIFSMKEKQGKRFEILTPKQMLQILTIALAQVKAGNTFENLLNEIRQIIHSLYRTKEIIKKGYNNIMNSVKV